MQNLTKQKNIIIQAVQLHNFWQLFGGWIPLNLCWQHFQLLQVQKLCCLWRCCDATVFWACKVYTIRLPRSQAERRKHQQLTATSSGRDKSSRDLQQWRYSNGEIDGGGANVAGDARGRSMILCLTTPAGRGTSLPFVNWRFSGARNFPVCVFAVAYTYMY